MKRFLQAGCAAAVLALAATPVLAAPPAPPGPPPRPMIHQKQWQAMRQTILDAELIGFKASLSLTPQQQTLWPAFEAALRAMPAGPGPYQRGEMHRPEMKGHGMQRADMHGPGNQGPGNQGQAMHGQGMERPDRHAGMPPSPAIVMHRIAHHLAQRAMHLNALSKAAGPLYAGLDAKQQLVFRAMLWRLGFMHPGPGPWMHDRRG